MLINADKTPGCWLTPWAKKFFLAFERKRCKNTEKDDFERIVCRAPVQCFKYTTRNFTQPNDVKLRQSEPSYLIILALWIWRLNLVHYKVEEEKRSHLKNGYRSNGLS